MLRARILTTLFLFVLIGGILVFGGFPGWVVFSALVVLGAAWEWASLVRFQERTFLVFISSIFLLLFNLATIPGVFSGRGFPGHLLAIFCGASAVFWLVFAPLWLKFHWKTEGKMPMLFGGCLLLTTAWMAQLQLASHSFILLLAGLGVTWVADIGAYFVGRRWGKHLLAPKISPGKTWEGWGGGVVAALAYALLWLPYTDLLFKEPMLLPAKLGLIGCVMFVAGGSVIGDLFESWIKRQAGVKDSGFLLPGHGGILDRIDAQLLSLPLLAGALFMFESGRSV